LARCKIQESPTCLTCTNKYIYDDILVGGFNPSEKILVSWDDYSQYMEKSKMFETTNQASELDVNQAKLRWN
jgi:hypothetical protein